MELTASQEDARTGLFLRMGCGFSRVFQRLANGRSLFGLIVVTVLLVVGFGAPWIAPHDPAEMRWDKVFLAPFAEQGLLLGTDQYGRDVLSRLIYGARVSLVVGSAAVLVEAVLGIALGLLSGYYGRLVDHIIMRAIDIIYPFPRLLLALFLVAIVGHSMAALIFVIAIGGVPRMTRIVRAAVLSVKERPYITAAKAAGLRDHTILFFYVLPNVIAPVIVLATLDVADAITTEATLTFLGLGADPTLPTWGSMLSEGRPYLRVYPQLCILPGVSITVAVLGFNSFGDGMRDTLDPRLRRGARRD